MRLKIMIKYCGIFLYFSIIAALATVPILHAAVQNQFVRDVYLLKVTSNSMKPVMRQGDIIVVKKVRQYVTKDVIAYVNGKDKKNITTHRITKTFGNNEIKSYQTKGDANTKPDPISIALERILGKVIFVFPFVGLLIDISQTLHGFVFLLIIGTIIVYQELQFIFNTIRNWYNRSP